MIDNDFNAKKRLFFDARPSVRSARLGQSARMVDSPLVAVGLLFTFLAMASNLVGQKPSATNGSTRSVARPDALALSRPVAIHWQDVPVRDALSRLGQTQQIDLVLDRRIDPETRLEVQLNGPLGQELDRLAVDQQWAVSRLPATLYIGPPETTAKLATIYAVNRQRVLRMERQAARHWLQRHPTGWEFLSEPREIVQRFAIAADVSLEGTEQIPHDVWKSAQLSDKDLIEQLTIVLAGFDLAVVPTGVTTGRIVRIPHQVTITEHLRVGDKRPLPLDTLREQFPKLKMKRADGTLLVRGRIEDVRALRQSLLGRPTRAHRGAAGRQERFSLRAEQQRLIDVLELLATREGLEIQWIAVDQQRRESRIDVDATQQSLAQLLRSILEPLGLRARRVDGRLIVEANEP